MKHRIETLTMLLTLTAILLVGCGGCAQKNVEQPIDQPSTEKSPQLTETPTNEVKPTQQDAGVNRDQDAQAPVHSPLMRSIRPSHGLWVSISPLPQIVISPDLKARASAELKIKAPALRRADLTDSQYDAAIYQVEAMIYKEALGTLAYAQYLAHHHRNRAYPFAKKALEENPDDYEALLVWVHVYTSNQESEHAFNDEARVAALRRLHKMNSDHPYVLQELAKAIYPTHAEEALSYAKKAIQLEHRYSWEGIDAVCYFQLGDYEKAIAAYERAYADAPIERLKQGPAGRLSYVKRALTDPEFEKQLQKWREDNVPLVGAVYVIRDDH